MQMQQNSISPLRQWSAISAEMQDTHQLCCAIHGCTHFSDFVFVQFCHLMQRNDSHGFAATAKSSSLPSAKFPIRETWMVL